MNSIKLVLALFAAMAVGAVVSNNLPARAQTSRIEQTCVTTKMRSADDTVRDYGQRGWALVSSAAPKPAKL